MKNWIVLAAIVLIGQIGYAQEKIEWSEDVEITASSFKGELPNLAEDDLQQYFLSATFDFSFYMANIQFALTKNFNRYVSAYYVPNLSWMEDGELTEQLLLMANLDFDLVELYARKFRKKMFETKNVGSNVNFYNSIHAEINKEYSDRQLVMQSELNNQSDIEAYLIAETEKVNQEIESLSGFCKSCKPKKKKRKGSS